MCLAAYLTPGAKLTPEQIETAWFNNSDGAGWGWAEKGKLHVQRYSLLNAFKPAFLEWQEKNDYPCMVHFRFGTQGSRDKQNVHPFFVNDSVIMCHNGVIGIESNAEADLSKSDTRIFNEYILAALPHNFFRNSGIIWLIESAIGTDKIIFMHKSGEVVIANENKGYWNEEKSIWFSNNSYEAKKAALCWDREPWREYYSNKYGKSKWTHEYKIPNYERCQYCDKMFNTKENTLFAQVKSKGLLPPWAEDDELICDDCFEEYEIYYREDLEKDTPPLNTLPAT